MKHSSRKMRGFFLKNYLHFFIYTFYTFYPFLHFFTPFSFYSLLHSYDIYTFALFTLYTFYRVYRNATYYKRYNIRMKHSSRKIRSFFLKNFLHFFTFTAFYTHTISTLLSYLHITPSTECIGTPLNRNPTTFV